jgi:hypothetical protein
MREQFDENLLDLMIARRPALIGARARPTRRQSA